MFDRDKFNARSHYYWLGDLGNLDKFYENLGTDIRHGNLTAHGDKGSCYEGKWARAGIHYFHGMAILLSSYDIHRNEVRDTKDGWVDPCQWVIDNYDRFKEYLPPIPPESINARDYFNV